MRPITIFVATVLLTGTLLGMPQVPLVLADESAIPAPTEQIQERGVLPNVDLNRKFMDSRMPGVAQPGGAPPAALCHTEIKMLTQCKCFNQAECQALAALFPNSCPAGSTHCEFVPRSRGAMPPLPPNLCGYQVPMTVTECTCHTATECQQLTPFCPGSCPAGSQSCTCRPMRRGH